MATSERPDNDWMVKAVNAEPHHRPAPDLSKPSPARMYDYYLGGKDNFAVDREAAEDILARWPAGRSTALNNRAFLVTAVRFLAEQGIDQFLDLGAGIPTSPNVHEIARETVPDARVVYVDNDPVVTAHTRAIRAKHPGVIGVEADIRDVAAVLADAQVRQTIDFTRPVAVLALAVLHFVDDDAVRNFVDTVRAAQAPGSWLAISAVTTDGVPEDVQRDGADIYRQSTSGGAWGRSRAEIAEWFDGYQLAEPGVVPVERWRADQPESSVTMLAGVGQLR